MGLPLRSTLVFTVALPLVSFADNPLTQGWKEVRRLNCFEARQAAVASNSHVYAIANKVIVKYDRETGKRVQVSSGEAHHLNSGLFHEGKVYLAHSNYPKKPDRSEIVVLDPTTMELTVYHDFGESDGSLTWAIPDHSGWWCHFAYYGDDNERSYLAHFDNDWQEQKRWTFPTPVLKAFGDMSASGGVWLDGHLVCTGHDLGEAYILKLPKSGKVLEYLRTVPVPFTGQAIAVDPVTGGLVGINRPKGQVVITE